MKIKLLILLLLLHAACASYQNISTQTPLENNKSYRIYTAYDSYDLASHSTFQQDPDKLTLFRESQQIYLKNNEITKIEEKRFSPGKTTGLAAGIIATGLIILGGIAAYQLGPGNTDP